MTSIRFTFGRKEVARINTNRAGVTANSSPSQSPGCQNWPEMVLTRTRISENSKVSHRYTSSHSRFRRTRRNRSFSRFAGGCPRPFRRRRLPPAARPAGLADALAGRAAALAGREPSAFALTGRLCRSMGGKCPVSNRPFTPQGSDLALAEVCRAAARTAARFMASSRMRSHSCFAASSSAWGVAPFSY